MRGVTSWSDIDSYKAAVRRFVENESDFEKFRSLTIDYNIILEHCSKDRGEQFRTYLELNYPELCMFAACEASIEDYGSPVRYDFGRWGTWSPTYMQYFKMLGDILKYTKIDKRAGKIKVVEIGGGYGGLARLLIDYIGRYRVDYTIYDLAIVGALQKKYLGKYGIEVTTICPCDADFIETDYDLCISTFALNECHNPLGQKYVEKVCRRSRAGYLVGLWIGGNSLRLDEVSTLPGAYVRDWEPFDGAHACKIVHWPA